MECKFSITTFPFYLLLANYRIPGLRLKQLEAYSGVAAGCAWAARTPRLGRSGGNPPSHRGAGHFYKGHYGFRI